MQKGGASRGHEKQIEEMNKKYNEIRAKEKQKEMEKEQKKKEKFEKDKDKKKKEDELIANRKAKK